MPLLIEYLTNLEVALSFKILIVPLPLDKEYCPK